MSDEKTTVEEKKPLKKSKLQEWTETIIWAVALALIIKALLIGAYKIPTGSMQPTLLGADDYKIGDHLLVNKFIYGSVIPFTDIRFLPPIRKPYRGDVVVFKYPLDTSKDFVKRCIGLPGETFEIKNKVVYINGKPLAEPWLYRYPHANYFIDGQNMLPAGLSPRDNFGPIIIPSNSYFMMGDNRDNSSDSRFWGVLEYKYIRGQAIVVYWPPDFLRMITKTFVVLKDTGKKLYHGLRIIH